MVYAYIENDEVVKTGELPKSYKNMSNFYLMSSSIHKENGFLPIENAVPIGLSLDQYYGSVEYDVQEDKVVSSRPVVTRTVDEVKAWMINLGKNVAERGLQEDYSLLYLVLGLSGQLGTTYKDNVGTAVSDWIIKFNTFEGEVNACTTKAQLLAVWDSYPTLQKVGV